MLILSNNNNNISTKTIDFGNYALEIKDSEGATIKQSASWILSGYVSVRN